MTADDHLLIGAYAVGALDRHETVEFEAHLAGCEACHAEVAELTETAAQLAVAVPASVSEPLLDRVMQQVRATPQLPPLHPPPGRINGNANPSPPPARFADSGGSVTPLRRRTTGPARKVLGVAAAIALVLLTGTMAIRVIGEQSRPHEMAAIVDDPTTEHFALQGVPPASGTPAGTVDVHVQPGTGQAVVDARSLPALDPGKTYELWFMSGDQPRRAATFAPDDTGSTRVQFAAPVSEPTGFGVTVEPEGGSDTPTSPLVFQREA